MNKIKSFLSSNKIIAVILAAVLVAINIIIVICFSVKQSRQPVKEIIPTAEQTGSKKSSSETTSSIVVSSIAVDKIVLSSPSSVASSDTSSKKVTVKVDGNLSSKATSSKPTSSKSTVNKPLSSSKPIDTNIPIVDEKLRIDEVLTTPSHGDKAYWGDTLCVYHNGLDNWFNVYYWDKDKMKDKYKIDSAEAENYSHAQIITMSDGEQVSWCGGEYVLGDIHWSTHETQNGFSGHFCQANYIKAHIANWSEINPDKDVLFEPGVGYKIVDKKQ